MKLFLIRATDDGKQVIWNLEYASDTGFVLIDVRKKDVQLNYVPKRDENNKEGGLE